MEIEYADQDSKWMRKAIQLAKQAAKRGEIPVGALLVSPEGKLLSSGSNIRENSNTVLGHAELLAIHRANKKQNSWRLEDCTLYITLEPCVMCAGAIQQSRIGRVVYGAKDVKGGAVNSLYQILNDSRLNHQVTVTQGVLEQECSEILKDFFGKKRFEKRVLKSERVYRRRTSAIVIHDNKILGFNAIDPTSGAKYFFLPGGKIEVGEAPEKAAEREAFEETGYKIRILPETEFTRRYDFEWDGQTVFCETIFYGAVLDESWHPPKPIKDASYHKGVAWNSIGEIKEIFSYQKDIFWAVSKMVKNYSKSRLRGVSKK